MAMVQEDTTTMTMATDINVDEDNTAVVRIYATRQPAGANKQGGLMMDA
jgi:hypothetical protein